MNTGTTGKLQRTTRKLKRSARLCRRFKNVLRCEWCNRWTEVGPRKWHQLRKDHLLFPAKYTYYCGRPSCKAGRDEIIAEKK